MSGEMVVGSRVKSKYSAVGVVGVVTQVATQHGYGPSHDMLYVRTDDGREMKCQRVTMQLESEALAYPTGFERFLDAPVQDVPDADMWRFLPDMLEELAHAWGKPLTGRAAQSWAILTSLFRMTPDGVVAAVMATLTRRGA